MQASELDSMLRKQATSSSQMSWGDSTFNNSGRQGRSQNLQGMSVEDRRAEAKRRKRKRQKERQKEKRRAQNNADNGSNNGSRKSPKTAGTGTANRQGKAVSSAPATKSFGLGLLQPKAIVGRDDAMSSTTLAHLTDTPFSAMPMHPDTLRAIHEVQGYKFCTKVQLETMAHISSGKDVIAKAKTGTGKTMGFLIPSLDVLINSRIGGGEGNYRNIRCLIISPTRELALQIKREATQLTSFHRNIKCETVFGGTKMSKDVTMLKSRAPDILVATPGRLHDHLKNTPKFVEQLNNLQVLILDEADQLMEMGFRPDIERIISYLPKNRQTLMFSATVPKDLQAVMRKALRPNEQLFIDTVGQTAVQTNTQVEQSAIICEFDNYVHVLAQLVLSHMQPPFKIMVFFATARVAGFMAEFFSRMGLSVLEMHSRKSQSYRTKTATKFRNGSNMLMFSSDVSARNGLPRRDLRLPSRSYRQGTVHPPNRPYCTRRKNWLWHIVISSVRKEHAERVVAFAD
jgi:hypothetical protein